MMYILVITELINETNGEVPMKHLNVLSCVFTELTPFFFTNNMMVEYVYNWSQTVGT